MKNKFIYLALLAIGMVSCDAEIENAVDANYTAGDADFSTYVAIGNSLSAGYMDGTVYREGQKYSFPNTLSKQFALVGGGAFTQPSFEDDVNNLGGIMGIFGTRLVINASVGAPQNLAGSSSITLAPQATPYNNMGVPGAKIFHLLSPGYGNVAGLATGSANPYFVRHATSATATVLGDALQMNPTFFTNWIGANDVLSYATTGGSGVDQTGNLDASTYGGNDITDPQVFGAAYQQIVGALTANGAKGVCATIPSVTSIPYFTTVPFAPLSPSALGGSAVVDQLNQQLYGPLKQVFSAYGEPNRVNLLSSSAANPVLIFDADATDMTAQITGALTPVLGAPTATAFGMVFGKARQATANDLIVLPASSVIGTPNASSPSPLINVNGVSFPLENRWVLTATEKAKVATATAAYNAAIVSVANSYNIAVADMNAVMNQLISGLRVEDGTIYTADYFSSSNSGSVLFSLDGVHPNARGYAVIANQFINKINSFYNAKIPLVSAAGYPGVTIVASN